MNDIKASIILAEKVTSSCIEKIIKTLQSGKRNSIWMYLILKTNLNYNEEIKIGFDIIKHEENGRNDKYGFRVGEFILEKTPDENELVDENEDEIGEDFEAKRRKSVFRYKDTFTIFKQLPPLPFLDAGNYEFVVYEIQDKKRFILDTFQFEVIQTR